MIVKILFRVVLDAAVIAILLFTSAGLVNWRRAWILLGVLLLIRIPTAIIVFRANPDLMRERSKLPIHREQPAVDRLLVIAVLLTGFILLPVIAACDVFRWDLLTRPPSFLANSGIVLFALGWILKGVVLRTNAYAAAAVRVQLERAHAVVDTGVYAFLRHPFYLGTVLVLVGMSLWLESLVALLASIVPITLVALRAVLEERFLSRMLAGYVEYAKRVRYRLFPGVW
jgi:protein-S-isoprenylcysteine O-methyltransferase Ste14